MTEGYQYHCLRCNHFWNGYKKNQEAPPRCCAKCSSAYWNIPRTNKVARKRSGPKREPVTEREDLLSILPPPKMSRNT